MIADVRAPLWALVRRLDERAREHRLIARRLRGESKINSYDHGYAAGQQAAHESIASQLSDVVAHLND